MSNVILGLLIIVGPQTVYTLNKLFQEGVSLFYSASLGALRSAIIRLLRDEHVSLIESAENGRLKKTYRITDAGRRAFQEWMEEPITDRDLEVAALSRLYFLGALPDATARRATLSAILARTTADQAQLAQVASMVDAVHIPDDLANLARFQRATLEYGLRSHALAVDFFTQLRDDEPLGALPKKDEDH